VSGAPDQALLAVGLRPTRQRRGIVDALRDRDDAVTAQDLHAALRASGEGIGLATVYRTLTALADAGFLDTFERDGELAFRLCGGAHHHHLVCEACGRVEEIGAGEVERWVAAVARRRGFTVTAHRADIFGVCRSCAAG